MEETGTHNTKVSDSGYSNSCSNSQSQRSGSSKSRHSGSSSGSSGYCGHPSTLGSSNDSFQHPSTTKQRKEYKKKKLKAMAGDLLNDTGGVSAPVVASTLESLQDVATSSHPNIENSFLPANSSQNIEKENVQLNPLSHPSLSINCIKKLKGKDMMTGEEAGENGPSPDGNEKDDNKVAIAHVRKVPSFRREFAAVVSMQNGSVLFTTGNLTEVLGYRKDMWLERSLIDFVHPKDRNTLLSQIASGIATPLVVPQSNGNQNSLSFLGCKSTPFYCWMRQYRGLKSTGFGLSNKKASYLPCQLSLAFREISTAKATYSEEYDDVENDDAIASGSALRAILLVVFVRPVRSAYKNPNETCTSSTFTTRHSPSMMFTHTDSEVVPYFGYVPQDIVGRSVFDFYHPEDLPYLKEVYENVFKDKGQPFRSKPYRFRTQNGGFVKIETEWSSFVNPWTKKIEFVTGQHRVIKGPPNPDVLTPVVDLEQMLVSEEVIKESASLQQEITNILNEPAETSDATKCQMTKYCNELLKYIENFVDDSNPASNLSDNKPVSLSISDRDSVMLGEISPHHEYYDSKSSSETPPSYNFLSYNENIHRFFESEPKTTGSDESGSGSKRSSCGERSNLPSGGEEGKISPAVEFSCGGSQNSGLNQESGGSSDLSCGSGSGNNNDMFDNEFDNPYLNEELLSIHNEIIRKHLAQIQRERTKSDRDHQIKDGRHKKTYDKILDEQNGHGVKRSGSHSWEGEPFKSIKQTHTTVGDGQNIGNTPSAPKLSNLEPSSTLPKAVANSTDVNLWPPFSVTITPLQSSQPCGTHLSYSAAPISNSMMPVYYLPPDALPSARIGNCAAEAVPPVSPYIQPTQPPYIAGQFQYMTSMMYHPVAAMPMFGVPPVMYSPLTMLPAPLMPTQPMKPQGQPQQQRQPTCNNIQQSQQNKGSSGKKTQRPASQATSVKAEPGSSLCSVASNSLLQVLSETSKTERKSLGTPSRPSLSQDCHDCSDQEKTKPEMGGININDHLEHNIHNDSSSYYSSFYSFLKTDKSDESMKSLTENEGSVDMQGEKNLWRKELDNCGNVPEQMRRRIRKDPPWLENVSLSPDMVYRYQLSEKELPQVLAADLKILNDINQPTMVNDQLCQLYLDIESFHQQECALETSMGITSSSGTSSGEGDDSPSVAKSKKKYRSTDYHDRMVRLFEENAPMPPPLSHPNNVPTLLTVQSTT